MTPEPQARLFFALWPGDGLRAALHDLAHALRRGSGGRTTAADKLHLTLVFLGNVARRRIPQLDAIARGCAADGFELVLDKTGCWPRQRIVWTAPQNTPVALAQLVGALETALRSQDFRIEDRAWQPHITLLRDARAPAAVPPPVLDWAVRDFVLVESARGAGYRVLARWPLAAT